MANAATQATSLATTFSDPITLVVAAIMVVAGVGIAIWLVKKVPFAKAK
jgi:hypothetical protein